MYQRSPMTERVQAIREKCRSTKPAIDISRYRLVTEFYMNNPQLTGILKRAKNLRNLFEKLPVTINDDELIVGWQGVKYRSSALYPEVSWTWFMEELRTNNFRTRGVDPYELDEEDEKYLLNKIEETHQWTSYAHSDIPDETIITEPYYHDYIVCVALKPQLDSK